MRTVPIETLPVELRDVYTLLKRVENLPFEMQEMIISELAEYRELLTLLKFLSRTTWKAVMPTKHRTLYLPAFSDGARWNRLSDVLPMLATHCRFLSLSSLSYMCCEAYAVATLSVCLKGIIQSMPQLQMVNIQISSNCGDHERDFINVIMQVVFSLEARASLDVHEWCVPKSSLALEYHRAVARRSPARQPLRGLFFGSALMHASRQLITVDIASVQKLVMYQPRSLPQLLYMPSTLVYLSIVRCYNLEMATLVDFLRKSAASLQCLYVHTWLCGDQGLPPAARAGLPVVRLPNLTHLSVSLHLGQAPIKGITGEETNILHRHLDCPALRYLGLAELCNLMDPERVKEIIRCRSRSIRMPILWVRQLSERGREILQQVATQEQRDSLRSHGLYTYYKKFHESEEGIIPVTYVMHD